MENLQNRIDNALENELSAIYSALGITKGDITPEQFLQWQQITESAATLLRI